MLCLARTSNTDFWRHGFYARAVMSRATHRLISPLREA